MDEKAKLRLFEKTMLPHLRTAHNLARWYTKNPQDAEDLVQESYIKAFRYFEGFHGENGRTWFLTIVRNTCLTWLRGSKPAVEFDERVHGSASDQRNVEERLVTESELGSLRKCIEGLPVDYREIVVMRELDGMSYKDIAEAVTVPTGTIMSRLWRARRRLEDCMAASPGAQR
jgi:RNA polymerase sigma factor (sigma-70 family)